MTGTGNLLKLAVQSCSSCCGFGRDKYYGQMNMIEVVSFVNSTPNHSYGKTPKTGPSFAAKQNCNSRCCKQETALAPAAP